MIIFRRFSHPLAQKNVCFLPVWVLSAACGLVGNGVFEDLAAVDLLLHRAARDEAVHHHVLGLPDAERSVHSLGISGRVPAGIICQMQIQNVNIKRR